MTRLFVPLSTMPFEQFERGEKEYELRRYGRQFTEKNVFTNQVVELRKGYSGASLWGTIGDVHTGRLEDVLSAVDYRLVEPHVASADEAIAENRALLGLAECYILFRVLLGPENSLTSSR